MNQIQTVEHFKHDGCLDRTTPRRGRRGLPFFRFSRGALAELLTCLANRPSPSPMAKLLSGLQSDEHESGSRSEV